MSERDTSFRKYLPWVIVAILALTLGFVTLRRNQTAGSGNAVNGVVQDNSGRTVLYWADPMFAQGPPHNYKSNKPGIAPDCHMKLVPIYGDAPSSQAAPASVSGYSNVALSGQQQQLVGVKVAKVETRDLSQILRASGVVTVDETRKSQIHAKFDGFIEKLYVNFTGEVVRRGQPLLSIYSPDLVATQNDLILAARSRRQFGDTLYDAARRRLLLWDVSSGDIDAIVRSGKLLRAVTLRSPVDGVVISKMAVAGARVMPGDPLYELADLREVWVLADVHESDLPHVHTGQPVKVVSYGRTWEGHVSFIPPVIDAPTRTAKIRITLSNLDGALKPDMFTDVIIEEPIGAGLAVPDTAVMQTGTRSIVFVDAGNGHYLPREVAVGVHAGSYYQIRSGLSAGETVVAEANFMVDSESRLKSAMGSGPPDSAPAVAK